MTGHGGARSRSGPQPDPRSAQSDRRGLKFVPLPSEGYRGEVPPFPMPGAGEREVEVWEQAWRTPQAAAWAREPWRHRTVAQWCRWSVRMEDPDCPGNIVAGVLRMQDQIGLSPAGLKENGWAISTDEVAERREERPAAADAPKRRLRAAPAGDA